MREEVVFRYTHKPARGAWYSIALMVFCSAGFWLAGWVAMGIGDLPWYIPALSWGAPTALLLTWWGCRPKALALLLKEDGLFLKVEGRRAEKVVPSKVCVSSLRLFETRYGCCTFRTEGRLLPTTLYFHEQEIAEGFARRLKKLMPDRTGGRA